MAPSRVTSFGLSVRKNEPFGWFAGCHRQFSLVRERPQAVSTRPLGLIDQPGCFRPLGRPRCCGVGQLAADVDMAVCFHVRSITRDVPATIRYMLVWKCISLVQQMISCSLRANKWPVSYYEKNTCFFSFSLFYFFHYDQITIHSRTNCYRDVLDDNFQRLPTMFRIENIENIIY